MSLVLRLTVIGWLTTELGCLDV